MLHFVRLHFLAKRKLLHDGIQALGRLGQRQHLGESLLNQPRTSDQMDCELESQKSAMHRTSGRLRGSR